MAAMRLPQIGGCLCGALRYEITRPPSLAYTCHCRDCQRLTGSAFATAIVVATEAFALVGPEPRALHRIADSGRILTRWVCPTCGVWVCGIPRPGSVVIVRAGTLDDTSWVRPTTHFWTRSAHPWVTLPEGGTRFETQPEDRSWLQPDVQARSETRQGSV